jgi:hypothetical protein
MRFLSRLVKWAVSSVFFGELMGCALFTCVLYGVLFGWRAALIVILCYFLLVLLTLLGAYLLRNVPTDP